MDLCCLEKKEMVPRSSSDALLLGMLFVWRIDQELSFTGEIAWREIDQHQGERKYVFYCSLVTLLAVTMSVS